ncbi:hypothetical protein VTI74DRAFT_9778 [Chaetomium olivicolor]
MQSPQTTNSARPRIIIDAVPLTPEAFAPFGDVIENPRPAIHPSSADKHRSSLPANAVTANQGSAIKYQHVSRHINLYDQAPSGRPATAIVSMFVCAARARIPDPHPVPTPASARLHDSPQSLPPTFPITVLERHPFTTQSFIPLTANPEARYLVVVAPSLPPSPKSSRLPVPTSLPKHTDYPRPLPGPGLPELQNVKAFVATARQAITYGAGTWHAPMVALGKDGGEAMDFVVVQFANGEVVEDCQEVYFQSDAVSGEAGAVVRLGTGEGKNGRVVKL